jgi:hypothetical protein
LRERRARLAVEIGGMDALTLRKMEREEIMKGVLRWLFGPTFDFTPADIRSLLSRLEESPPEDPARVDYRGIGNLSNDEWMRVMEYGEFIKYIHNSIEWENLLFFTYPYFWDERNWEKKIFLNHPDSRHRDFLRAGSARVVVTIRPGFEISFAELVESGAFGEALGENHPYVTIGQEIENAANTNYPGIPPANPEAGETEQDVDKKVEERERGILVARWYEYTPTSALDLAVSTPMAGDLA